jgi:3-oxoacyl-[acyl-carrier-protein] synthase II
MSSPIITGIGSVTPFGAHAGLIAASPLQPTPIPGWTYEGVHRAFTVAPFDPASIIPGLRTRRLDRLSAWALVASSLALQDSGIDLDSLDRTRVAVVLATDFGCIELTEAFFQSALTNGWSGTDPITFPETLANLPSGHVALRHNVRGPNLTVSSKNFGGETALLQAASLLRNDQADVAIVLAGDTLTQTIYEWYKVARRLAPSCLNDVPFDPGAKGFVPSEGLVAFVLEAAGARDTRTYATLRGGRTATGGDIPAKIAALLAGETPKTIIQASRTTHIAEALASGTHTAIVPAQPVALGMPDSGGLLHLLLALSANPASGPALMLATSPGGGYAAVLLDLP